LAGGKLNDPSKYLTGKNCEKNSASSSDGFGTRSYVRPSGQAFFEEQMAVPTNLPFEQLGGGRRIKTLLADWSPSRYLPVITALAPDSRRTGRVEV
jgi:hypothetical protein